MLSNENPSFFKTKFQTPFFSLHAMALCRQEKGGIYFADIVIENVLWQATDFECLFIWKCELRNVILDL